MYYSHNYRDPEAKASAVRENIQVMAMRSFKGNVPDVSTADEATARDMVRRWIFDNPEATITELSDFVSKLIEDYQENRNDRDL